MNAILTAEMYYRDIPELAPAERANLLHGDAARRPRGLADGPPVVAEVNRGRWVGKCPLANPATGLRCTSAQVLAVSDPRYFCADCGNAEAGGLALPVAWPPERARRAIERLLLARPDERDRNWLPGWSIAELRRQNRENGVG
jgi:hypothetical protein